MTKKLSFMAIIVKGRFSEKSNVLSPKNTVATVKYGSDWYFNLNGPTKRVLVKGIITFWIL